MRGFLALLSMVFVFSCSQSEPSATEVARGAVKAVLRPTISTQFPGVPTDIITDCVIENASASEIVQIANSALLGSPTDTSYATLPIAKRPATLQCVAAKSLGV